MQGLPERTARGVPAFSLFPASFSRLSGVPYVFDCLQHAPYRSGPGFREVSADTMDILSAMREPACVR